MGSDDRPLTNELQWGVRDDSGQVTVHDEETARQLAAADPGRLALVTRGLVAERWHPPHPPHPPLFNDSGSTT